MILLPPTTENLLKTPTTTIGGLSIAVVDRRTAAEQIVRLSRERRGRPLYLTSANGEVIARASVDPKFRALLQDADQIVADGQSMVLASRAFCREPLPERVATTDLFHDVAKLAEVEGVTFYMLGASPEQNERAVANVRRRYPRLNLIGHSHGYLTGEALDAKLREIDALKPDVLWLAMGVPREQQFISACAHLLPNVGVIKTSGGLFDFLSGKNRRAPMWMQRMGFEWLFRLGQEPRRLFWRYLVTNPTAIYLMVTRSR